MELTVLAPVSYAPQIQLLETHFSGSEPPFRSANTEQNCIIFGFHTNSAGMQQVLEQLKYGLPINVIPPPENWEDEEGNVHTIPVPQEVLDLQDAFDCLACGTSEGAAPVPDCILIFEAAPLSVLAQYELTLGTPPEDPEGSPEEIP